MAARPGAPAFTAAEYGRYLAVLKCTTEALGRPPSPAEFNEACGGESRRPYRCLQKLIGVPSWREILARLGYEAITAETCRQYDRKTSASRKIMVAGGKMREWCSNRPECTGKPIAPGLFYCPACDPTQRDAGMVEMGLRKMRMH